MIVSGGVAWIERAVEARRDDEHAALERVVRVALPRARSSPRPCQPARSKRSPVVAHVVEQLRHLVEHDERRGARERVADVRVRVDVLGPELPELLEAVAVEERGRERQPAAERLADAEHVGDLARRATSRRRGRARRRSSRRRAARRPRRSARRSVSRKPSGGTREPARPCTGSTITQPASSGSGPGSSPYARRCTGPGSHGCERLAEALEPGRREREQAGAVVGAVERDDARPAGREQRRAQRDLDRVLAGDAELRRPRQRLAQPHGHLRVGEVAERVHDLLLAPRLEDARVAVTERRDAEAAGQVEQLAPVGERDAAALGARPDHSRRPRTRPTVAFAIVPAIAGFSCSRRSEYSYHCSPNGT